MELEIFVFTYIQGFYFLLFGSVHNQVSQHLENETYNLLGWQIWTVFWCLPPLMWAETFIESSPFNFPSLSVSTLPATTNWSPGSGKEKSSLFEKWKSIPMRHAYLWKEYESFSPKYWIGRQRLARCIFKDGHCFKIFTSQEQVKIIFFPSHCIHLVFF